MTENERQGMFVTLEQRVEISKCFAELDEYKAIGTVEEFKHYKHTVHMAELAIDSIEKERAEIRNKAIDEFEEALKKEISFKYGSGQINHAYKAKEKTLKLIDEIAEQLKEGVE